MRYPELSYRKILQGFLKTNLILLCIVPFLWYLNIATIADYFCLMKWQVVSWVVAVLSAVFYEKLRFSQHQHRGSIYESSIYVGAVIATVFCTLFAELLLHKVEAFEIIGIAILLGVIWVVYIFIVLKLESLLRIQWYIKLLDSKISYKDLLQVFLLLNISCGFFIFFLLFFHNKYSLMEFIFLLLYFEISFFVFHIVVAKLTDLVWANSSLKSDSMSLCGFIVASVFYVIKLKLVEESFFKIFEDVYINDSKALILMIVLSLCWTFFVLLFNFKIKLPRKA
ncbi:MAG: hypothetical protein KBC27_01550 [Rickettsiales bacterium]|nr:hypothetical protein [Rickettsiales bacterium]